MSWGSSTTESNNEHPVDDGLVDACSGPLIASTSSRKCLIVMDDQHGL
jgi:hypothetical protein